ncbi:malate dehydrogenase [Thecamonas trahens ATCC 50062]|uniref:malate dehydrogenase n=1 Tax=Thecamonas trahens ATCC 50062 TaxID=461836 RepID=A0A0L0DPE7_THETB|nr:malate dehydrogenase [Thecamonas trahens ATCC 50062]KNC53298.1 malate dehydrogenase [Thecamonas trahens ATCC 50062]|eukprot:XP_013754559.1 malate dehydrogenase [Thecamonas trahens ATCC 50062]
MSNLKPFIRVAVTGAAGQICYSLLANICKGEMFGADQPVVLHLLDITPALGALRGVTLELEDCSFPLLVDFVVTDKPAEAFADVDVAILVGAMPRREGMVRADLLKANAGIFKAQGAALAAHAKPSVRVLVVGNPANTNALIALTTGSSLPKSAFTALTFLDHNRLKAQVACKLGVAVADVRNTFIWGNHSKTQYPDVSHGTVTNADGSLSRVMDLAESAWARDELVTTVQTRGAAVIKARKLSSAMSAAKAITDHMRTWWFGTEPDDIVSMAIYSDGTHYGVAEGIIFSFPVTIDAATGDINVVDGLDIDAFSQSMLDKTQAELIDEREAALAFLAESNL